MQDSSTTRKSGASPTTSIASEGQMRTQARHATHRSASIRKLSKDFPVRGGRALGSEYRHSARLVSRLDRVQNIDTRCFSRILRGYSGVKIIGSYFTVQGPLADAQLLRRTASISAEI